MAEVYGRPFYPYPAPVIRYPLPYPTIQTPRLSEPTVPLQQQSTPQEAPASATSNIQTLETTSTENNPQVSVEPSSSKIPETEHPAGDNPRTDKIINQHTRTETSAKDSNNPILTEVVPPSNLSKSDNTKNVDSNSTIEPLVSSDKADPAPEQTITDISVSDLPVEKTIDDLHAAVPKEIPIAEQLLLAQPKIETAIKRGNFAEAYYLWRPLAEGGDPSAQYGIGWMYHNGYGLAIDDQKAYEWWSRAAAQNYVEAIFSIGTLYQFGYGPLQKDMRTALGYYLMAAVAGHEESRLILQTMLDRRDRNIKPILPALLRYHLYSAIAGESDSHAVLRKMLQTKDSRIQSILPKLLNFYLESTIAGDLNSQQILKQMLLQDDSRISAILPRLLEHYRESALTGNKTSQQILRTLMLRGDKRTENLIADLLKSHPKILGNIPATVRVKHANTRKGPSTSFIVVKVVKQGDQLVVIDQKDGWMFVQLTNSDKRAWISGRLITLTP